MPLQVSGWFGPAINFCDLPPPPPPDQESVQDALELQTDIRIYKKLFVAWEQHVGQQIYYPPRPPESHAQDEAVLQREVELYRPRFLKWQERVGHALFAALDDGLTAHEAQCSLCQRVKQYEQGPSEV